MIQNGSVRRRTWSETRTPPSASNEQNGSDWFTPPPSVNFSRESPECGHQRNSCCVFKEEHILIVAERTVKDWKRILRHLKIEQHVIETIELDNQHSAFERAYKGFLYWQRKNPKVATCCTLFDVLDRIGRGDVKSAMETKFGIKGKIFRKNSIYTTSVKAYVGRSNEIKQIRQFCDMEQKDKRLLCINGLPGSGKKELVIEALKVIDSSVIAKPNFMMEDRQEWTFRDLLDCIVGELRKFISKEISGKVNVVDLLVDLEKPCILVLEIAHLKLDYKIFNQIWTFIHDVLRNSKNRLKIVATSCRHPEEVLCNNINYNVISLDELCLQDAGKLLRILNPNLSMLQTEGIYDCLGGNPLLLRKISTKIKSFRDKDEEVNEFLTSMAESTPIEKRTGLTDSASISFKRQESNIHEELHILVKNTNWWEDMTSVFNMMDESEKMVLATASVFYNRIPRRAFACIFNDEKLKKDAESLCINHCILKKTVDSTCYFITEFYKTFIIKYIEAMPGPDGEHLKAVRERAKFLLMSYFLKLLVELSKLFFSKNKKKSHDICDNFVRDFRDSCSYGKAPCECENYTVAKGIFIKHKVTFINSLKKVLHFPQHLKTLFTAPYEVVYFLYYVLSHQEVCRIYCIFWNLHIESMREKSVLLASLVFIKVYRDAGYSNENLLYLQMINQCIGGLQNRNLSYGFLEILLACYLKKASLLLTIANDYHAAEKEVMKAKMVFNRPGFKIGLFNYYGLLADVACCEKRYGEAKKDRERQFKNFQVHLGYHPFTGKACFLLAKVCECTKSYYQAIKIYQEALQIYHHIKHYNIEYGRICLALANLLKEVGRFSDMRNIVQHGAMVITKLQKLYKPDGHLHIKCQQLLTELFQLIGENCKEEKKIQSPRVSLNPVKVLENSEYFLNNKSRYIIVGKNAVKYFLWILLFLCINILLYIVWFLPGNCKA